MVQLLRSTHSCSTLTPICSSNTKTCKLLHHEIAKAVLPLWNKLPPVLQQISVPSYKFTKTSPLAISPHLFHSKLKSYFFTNPIFLLPPSACLSDSLDLIL